MILQINQLAFSVEARERDRFFGYIQNVLTNASDSEMVFNVTLISDLISSSCVMPNFRLRSFCRLNLACNTCRSVLISSSTLTSSLSQAIFSSAVGVEANTSEIIDGTTRGAAARKTTIHWWTWTSSHVEAAASSIQFHFAVRHGGRVHHFCDWLWSVRNLKNLIKQIKEF